MTDPFGRTIKLSPGIGHGPLHLRCFYCMSEDRPFCQGRLSRSKITRRLCSAFIAKGVEELAFDRRRTLVRRNVLSLVRSLSRHLDTGALNELTLTTNGSQLARFARRVAGTAGYGRINVSLDTLDPANSAPSPLGRYRPKVLGGIEPRAPAVSPSRSMRWR